MTILISSDTLELCLKEMESQHWFRCSPQLKRKERTQQFIRTRQRTILSPMGPQRERAVQELMSQVHAMKIVLDQRLGTTVKTDWKALEWMVEFSAVLINRCLVGHDGKTAYSRLMVKNSSKEVVEFGARRGQIHSVPHIHPEAGSHEPLGGRHLGGRCEEVQRTYCRARGWRTSN